MRALEGLFAVVLLVALLALASPAEAAGNACFTWDCDENICAFDASCSSADPYIWKYEMDFGDGTSTGLTGNSSFNHTYTDSERYEATVTLKIHFFSTPESDSATCTISTQFFPVGGTNQPLSGTCD